MILRADTCDRGNSGRGPDGLGLAGRADAFLVGAKRVYGSARELYLAKELKRLILRADTCDRGIRAAGRMGSGFGLARRRIPGRERNGFTVPPRQIYFAKELKRLILHADKNDQEESGPRARKGRVRLSALAHSW